MSDSKRVLSLKVLFCPGGLKLVKLEADPGRGGV